MEQNGQDSLPQDASSERPAVENAVDEPSVADAVATPAETSPESTPAPEAAVEAVETHTAHEDVSPEPVATPAFNSEPQVTNDFSAAEAAPAESVDPAPSGADYGAPDLGAAAAPGENRFSESMPSEQPVEGEAATPNQFGEGAGAESYQFESVSFGGDDSDLYGTLDSVEELAPAVEENEVSEDTTAAVRELILTTDVGPDYYDTIRRAIYSSSEELECVSDIDVEEISDPFKAAVLLDLQGRRRDCIDQLAKTDSLWAVQLQSILLLEEGKVAEVLTLLKEAMPKHNSAAELSVLWVEALATSGDIEGARKSLEGLELGEDSRSAEYLEGLLLEREGYYHKALESYNKAIQSEDPPARYCFRLAYLESLHGEEERAMEVYEMLKNAVPVYARAMINLGIIYEDFERYEEAYQCYETILTAYPDHERAAMYIADTEYSQDMYYDREKEKEKLRRKQLLQIPVTDFELSVRSRNCLSKMNIHTLGDLIQKTEAELLSYKNFGETSLTEIKKILSQKGFRLGQGLDDKKRSIASDPQKSSLLNEPVSVLELSSRAQRCMDRLGIESLHDLVKRTELELVGQRNFGVTSLQEVKRKLKERGLSLASG